MYPGPDPVEEAIAEMEAKAAVTAEPVPLNASSTPAPSTCLPVCISRISLPSTGAIGILWMPGLGESLLTAAVNVCESLWAGELLSMTRTVTEYVAGPPADVQVRMPETG